MKTDMFTGLFKQCLLGGERAESRWTVVRWWEEEGDLSEAEHSMINDTWSQVKTRRRRRWNAKLSSHRYFQISIHCVVFSHHRVTGVNSGPCCTETLWAHSHFQMRISLEELFAKQLCNWHVKYFSNNYSWRPVTEKKTTECRDEAALWGVSASS